MAKGSRGEALGGKADQARLASAFRVLMFALVVTVLCYLNTLWFGFVYDDHQIGRNPQASWHSVPSLFTQHLWAGIAQYGNYYRPVLALTGFISYKLWGVSPLGWHFGAVTIHLFNTFLVYLLVSELAEDRLLGAIAATIFGVHPVHIEVVAWASGAISESFLASSVLGCLFCYVRGRNRPGRAILWYAGALLLYASALLTKETALALPIVVFAYEWLMWRPQEGSVAQPSKRPFFVFLLFALISGIYLIVRHAVLQSPPGAQQRSLVAVLLTWPSALWFYARQLVWPLKVSLFHSVSLVTGMGFREFWVPALAVLATCCLIFVLARRSKLMAFASSIMIATILPPLAGIYALPKSELVHDRYLYLPSVGFSILLAVGIQQLWLKLTSDQAKTKTRPSLLFAIATLAIGFLTVSENVVWANDFTLYRHAVQVAPSNVAAVNLLANEMFKRGNADAALKLYNRALELDPEEWSTNFALGVTEFQLGRFQDAEREFQAATRIDEDNPVQFVFLSQARMKLGNFAGAEEVLHRGITLGPRVPGLHYLLGIALMEQGKLYAARDAFEADLRLDPASPARQQLSELQTRLQSGSTGR